MTNMVNIVHGYFQNNITERRNMVKYVKGNLFQSDANIIAHGVNCQGAFGSGVAKTMSEVYPRAKSFYFAKFNKEGWKLGDVQFVAQPDGRCVANSATQDHFLPRTVCHADYPAISKTLTLVKEFAQRHNLTIALPKIGAGLAGGDWDTIKTIIEAVFSDYDATVYYLDTP